MKTYSVIIEYRNEYPLSFVVDSEKSVESFLEDVFAWFNHGSQRESTLFLNSKRPSLSVDDYVSVDGVRYLCESVGWTKSTQTYEEYMKDRINDAHAEARYAKLDEEAQYERGKDW